MSNNLVNNKRIAKNTILLYIRMLISIVISLYTSRVILQTLGIEDFGIFGIVAGVASSLTFLNTSMSGATSRFFIFALGKKEERLLKETFSTAVEIHLIIALIVLLLAETVGLWLVNNKLVIPEERHIAAISVYHCSILATLVSIIQTPYKANIIAYEMMNVYAFIEIANVIFKLLIVYMLQFIPYDKLIVYGILYLVINLLVLLIYKICSDCMFKIFQFHFVWKKELWKPMLIYCGWDLFGNLSGTVKQQGTNIIINIFFGVLLNAASSVATQVQSAVSSLAANVIQAFRPQIIKNYAIGDIKTMEIQVCNAIKYTLILYGMCVLPLSFELDYVLKLWLRIVPEYATIFCRILLLNSALGLVSMIIITINHATGKIKYLSFITGIINIINIISIYVCYKFIGRIPEYAYYIGIFYSMVTIIMNFVITKRLIPEINLHNLIVSVLIPISIMIVVSIPLYYVTNSLTTSFLRLSIVVIASIIMTTSIVYFFVMDKSIRSSINRKLLRR